MHHVRLTLALSALAFFSACTTPTGSVLPIGENGGMSADRLIRIPSVMSAEVD